MRSAIRRARFGPTPNSVNRYAAARPPVCGPAASMSWERMATKTIDRAAFTKKSDSSAVKHSCSIPRFRSARENDMIWRPDGSTLSPN